MAKFPSPIENLWKREVDFLYLLKTMESRGVLLDQAMCRRERAIGEEKMFRLQTELGDMSPTSGRQLERLFRSANIPLLEDHKTAKGNYSFDKAAMADYDHLLELRADRYGDLAKKILEFRGWNKTVSSNYEPYLRLVSPDGRIRCNFNQGGTKTGRLSCNEPNLQQIPRSSGKRWNGNLKKAFVPKPGYSLVANDYSQLEFRLSAAYARQKNLMEIFNRSRDKEKFSKEDRDIFIQMCLEMGLDPKEARQDMKTLTYAKNFGAGLLKICIMLGEEIPDWVRTNYRWPGNDALQARIEAYKQAVAFLLATEAGKFFTAWEAKYDRIVANAKEVNKVAKSRGYVHMWTGRPRHFNTPGIHPGESRKAYNSVIQGGGAEIVKSAMLRLFKEVDNPDCLMLLQVHDSVVFEIKESKIDYYLPIIQETMSDVEREYDFGVHFASEPEFWGQ